MSGQIALQYRLNEALTQSKLKNPAFSIRAFAKRLGLSPAATSEILNGKRNVSPKMASKIIDKLCLDPLESQTILALFESSKGKELSYRNHATEVESDKFKIISDWYHFAILSLSETRGFQDDPHWISERLNIKFTEAASALERLERLGMLKKGAGGKLRPTGVAYTTSDEVVNLGLRKYIAQCLDLARLSLDQDELAERDFTSVTMAIDFKKIPAAKKMIRQFRDKLCAFMETGSKTEVYKLNVQLIPLTRTSRNL